MSARLYNIPVPGSSSIETPGHPHGPALFTSNLSFYRDFVKSSWGIGVFFCTLYGYLKELPDFRLATSHRRFLLFWARSCFAPGSEHPGSEAGAAVTGDDFRGRDAPGLHH